MNSILPIIQIVTSVLLVAAILLQQRGTGLSASFGGEGNVYRTKRGFEKILFYGTIVLGCLFFLSATVNILL
ncbi:MAG: preprotein translocase subunit SecG [Candidatus Sungbacteria bacterium RIFCSPLOWO2_01_FULL_47_10]|uniref:Protein-export membrane protein SecG n=1 Tax=Candidatus Sungbacteria bacterium RIFCSPLOWO2_01_FULL_47_10 TaxID=1802276 RepID=A0A1G2L5Z9_9BACT|nr:MAG: preprotein translocase subunit SecG [Candidatus Sungbacteria bacterium RIFCSPLOWO2_01_FULL_47_10]